MSAAALPVVLCLAACAAEQQRPPESDPSIEETRVYLETVQPEQVSWVRYQEPLRYTVVNNQFVVLDAQSGRYLMETERYCRRLTTGEIYTDTLDERRMRGRLRAGIDTLRGCRIEAIYKLPPLETEPDGTTEGPSNQPEEH